MFKKVKHIWRKNLPLEQEETAAGKNYPLAVELIGAPDDRGVMNVGGRLGASQGPSHLRSTLEEFMIGIANWEENVFFSAGSDIELGNNISEGHNHLRSKVSHLLSENKIPIVIGGGHDYGYPHVGGANDVYPKSVGLINVDAHLDLRPPNHLGITSGSPFFLALEEPVVQAKNFYEFGIQNHCNDRSLYDYALKKNVQIITLDDSRSENSVVSNFESVLKRLEKKKLKVVVSFDMDAVCLVSAPGVSAPQADGFSAKEFLNMVDLCAEHKSVVSIGFFEYAPLLDENKKTAKLLATAIHRFVSKLPKRLEKQEKGKRARIKRLLVGR